MSNIITISSYEPKKDEKFFFDTNIWLYLLCPVGNYNQAVVNKYNMFFSKIVLNKSIIYTSAMVISEFFNVYARIEFSIKQNSDPKKYKNYKNDFRNTKEYETFSAQVCGLIDAKILKYSIRIDDKFSTINKSNLLCQSSSYDFNDKYFVELCKDNKLKIVTNDKDFFHFKDNIDIITSRTS